MCVLSPPVLPQAAECEESVYAKVGDADVNITCTVRMYPGPEEIATVTFGLKPNQTTLGLEDSNERYRFTKEVGVFV